MGGTLPGQAAAQIPALTSQQIASMYNNYNGQQAQLAAQQANTAYYSQLSQQNAAAQHAAWMNVQATAERMKKRWMFDGEAMDLVTFANTVFGEDTPEATHFVLKHSK